MEWHTLSVSELVTSTAVSLAKDLGADAVGVAAVEPFERELATLRAHEETGLAGPLGFTYNDPEVAADITRSLPWVRSLISVGVSYVPRARTPAPSGAVVGRFATADHYEPVRRVAEGLSEWLHENRARAEVLIDDNRLLDRAVAVRAGIGWRGRSTMVLAPGHGPWMLLGTVATDARLEPTRPMRRGCGTCRACLPACPTRALDGTRLDARRCLSTWLQTAGSIPQWIRPHLGRRIYGCDDCLTSCPPGQRALDITGDRPAGLPLDSLLLLSDDQLLDRFSHWYVPHRDGRYLRRNLLVASGNSAEPEALDAVADHLLHPSSMIRGHAAWALARGAGAGGRHHLTAALETERAPEARDEIVLALLMVDHPEKHQKILELDEWVSMTQGVEGLGVVDEGESSLVVMLGHTVHAPPVDVGERLTFATADDPAPFADMALLTRVQDPHRGLEELRKITAQQISLL